jgi:undecaprenyl-diphosphatase
VTLLHLFVLALVQGITEFLPVSSSGHLVLIPVFTGWPDQGLAVDVAAHVGSLGAVLVYFWRDVWRLAMAGLAFLTGRQHEARGLLWLLVIATIPAVAAGAALSGLIETVLRDPAVIAWTMTIGAGLLYAADRYGRTNRDMSGLTLRDAIWIGLAQAVALIPGTSRSGITMTMARALGVGRTEAARFSMLLSIPVILGAGLLQGLDLIESGDALLTRDAILAAALSFIAALVTVAVLMRWLQRATFLPLVIYRLGL